MCSSPTLIRRVLLATLLLVPIASNASVFEQFGAGPRSAALVGALSGSADGGEAAFHNPALLTHAPLAGAWFGVAATGHALSVQLARPVCEGRYLACRGQHQAGFSSRAAQLPRDSQGFQLGWHYPLGGPLRGKAALGAGLSLPQGHIIRISGADPQTPKFLLYEGMPDRIAFLFAVAARLGQQVSLGVGVQVLAVLDAAIDLGLDPTNHRMSRAAIAIGLAPRARLTAGMAYKPLQTLTLGLSYRQRLSLEYKIPTTIDIGEPIKLDIALGHETLFTPDILHLGAGWKATSRLLLSAEASLAFWSQAPDPSPQVGLDVGGAAVQGLGLGKVLDVGTDTPPVQLALADTVSPGLAAEWRLAAPLQLRAGYRFRPSPAPRAEGPYNYLDNHAHAFGAGIGLRFGTLSTPLQAELDVQGVMAAEAPAPLRIDLGGQWLWLPRRTVLKRDRNDPVGDLAHGGSVWHAGLAFGGSF